MYGAHISSVERKKGLTTSPINMRLDPFVSKLIICNLLLVYQKLMGIKFTSITVINYIDNGNTYIIQLLMNERKSDPDKKRDVTYLRIWFLLILIHMLYCLLRNHPVWNAVSRGIVVTHWTAGQQGELSILHLGHDSYQTSSHLPRLSLYLIVWNCELKHHSFLTKFHRLKGKRVYLTVICIHS